MRYTLVDPHGNFGSVERRWTRSDEVHGEPFGTSAMEMLSDINKETVDMVPNYDDSTSGFHRYCQAVSPTFLSMELPGIAVGMATNMAPHNLTEVMRGTLAYREAWRYHCGGADAVCQGTRLPYRWYYLRLSRC